MITLHRARSFLKLPLALAIGMASFAAQQASAHGYIESPKSRAYMCSSPGGSLNANCGQIMYQPQSVEYHTNNSRMHFPSRAQSCDGDFRSCGPADGAIASGGVGDTPLDEQTATRWAKTTIKPGMNKFVWHYTAGHATRYWQFYITKKDWNPNKPLTRDSFEMTPLLDQPWPSRGMPDGLQHLKGKSEHMVNIPADHSGYHVILAMWKVHDNQNSFYQVVDVNIDNAGAVQSQWSDIGAVQPEPLKIGDKVMTRVFTNSEQPAKQVVLNIDNKNLTDENVWPLELAKKVNAANLGYQMGLLDDKDQVVPNPGKNGIYIKKGSDITNVIIDKVRASQPSELSISSLQPEYTMRNGQIELHFTAILKAGNPKDPHTISAKVFDANGKTLAYEHAPAGSLAPHFAIALKDLKAGKYDLVVVSKSDQGELLQQTHSFTVKAEPNSGGSDKPVEGGDKPGNGGDKPAAGGQYDYKFPEGLSSYKGGTKVLGRDGNIYKCKDGQQAGFCVQWSSSATQFEPGRGSSWTTAWDRQ
ncbi:lytic polysaccharide monooxygenase [Pseudomonas sp. NFXW11]|uniref:lytic polysaccharide monooxygenase n=1 Tax=Pseudomonas sp. NFXW11 TaxID=2819531 RepID=UPI003CF5602F